MALHDATSAQSRCQSCALFGIRWMLATPQPHFQVLPCAAPILNTQGIPLSFGSQARFTALPSGTAVLDTVVCALPLEGFMLCAKRGANNGAQLRLCMHLLFFGGSLQFFTQAPGLIDSFLGTCARKVRAQTAAFDREPVQSSCPFLSACCPVCHWPHVAWSWEARDIEHQHVSFVPGPRSNL